MSLFHIQNQNSQGMRELRWYLRDDFLSIPTSHLTDSVMQVIAEKKSNHSHELKQLSSLGDNPNCILLFLYTLTHSSEVIPH